MGGRLKPGCQLIDKGYFRFQLFLKVELCFDADVFERHIGDARDNLSV